MGSFLTVLKNNIQEEYFQNLSLLNSSLAKLREYHGSFKSVCDSFSIDLSEFKKIFNQSDKEFNVWDTDNNRLIDALELFTGLIIFSDSKFVEKIRFLFDLYDFNELNSLSRVDIEFMLIAVQNATLKICKIKAEVNEEETENYLKDYFSEESRINISQLLKWCQSQQEILQFCEMIKKELPEYQQDVDSNDNLILQKKQQNTPTGEIINNKKQQQMQEYMISLNKKVQVCKKLNHNVADTQAKINWVYGYRCQDVKKSMVYFPFQQTSSSSEYLIYFTACIVVIYYPKLNSQKQYLQHESEIISIASGKNIVATGELANEPAIHIWNPDTLKTYGQIKGVHRKGIHLLMFIDQDKYLVSCGIRKDSPILIHSTNNFNLLVSTLVEDDIIDLFKINSYIGRFQKVESDGTFVVCMKNKFKSFTHNEGYLKVETVDLQTYCESPFQCGTAFKINPKNPALRAYCSKSSLVIITGHNNGQVNIFKDYQFQKELINYKVQIRNIVSYSQGIIIAIESAILYFWDLQLKNNIFKIDITCFQFKLFNFKVRDLIINDEILMVTTTDGDVVEITADFHEESQNRRIKAKRINYINKIQGKMNSISLLEKGERIVYIAGDASVVYAFSLQDHDIIDLWTVGNSITAIDCLCDGSGGTIFAIGCQNGKIFLRIDWEESPIFYEAGQQIFDVKFSSDGQYLAAVCENKDLYVFQNYNQNYFQTSPKQLHFDNEIPLSINFTDENKTIIVGTNHKNQYKIDLEDMKFKNVNLDSNLINCKVWNVRYTQKLKNYSTDMLPIVIGGEIKSFIAATQDGSFFIWKDLDALQENCGAMLKGHASQISRILFSQQQDIFFTLGQSDNTMIEWRIDQLYEKEEYYKIRYDQRIEESLQREIDYSTQRKQEKNLLKDQFIALRGSNQQFLNQIFENKYQINANNYLHRRPPSISIKLDYVLGFQAYDKRDTLFYISKTEQKFILELQPDQLPTDRYVINPIENQKEFVYFVSRVGIILDPVDKKQRFYERHQNKITCMAVHSSRYIVASGETGKYPQIHVWNTQSLEPIAVIKTQHTCGIVNLIFSTCGELIISLGFDKIFCLEIIDWKNQESIALRNLKEPVFCIKSDPRNKYEFVTCGLESISFWSCKGKNLQRKQVVKTQSGPTDPIRLVSSMEFMEFHFENDIQYDLICGNSIGDIAVVSDGNYITVREQAHYKIINSVKIYKLQKLIIITSSEDEVIRIWDNKFNMLQEIKLRTLSFLKDCPSDQNLSAQSIDLFNNEDTTLLIGTRNGCILEATIEMDLKNEEKYDKNEIDDQFYIKSFSFTLFQKSHCSQQQEINDNKKVFFSLHPNQQVIATVGDNQQLIIWDINTMQILAQEFLNSIPSAIKYSPDGDILIVGFVNGHMTLYSSQMQKNLYSQQDEEPYLISLEQLPFDNDSNISNTILNIEFSSKNEMMVVSYDNMKKLQLYDNNQRMNSFISVYKNQFANQKKNYQQQDKSYYLKTIDIKNPSINENYATDQSQYGMGVYFMVFSQDQSHLLLYYQIIDSQHIRVNNDPEGQFVVWDLHNNNTVKNQAFIKDIKWDKLNFPNSINAQNIYHQKINQADQKDEQQQPILTSMFDSENQLIMGGDNGNIYFAKQFCLDSSSQQDNINQKMCLGKSYAAHCSFVNQIELKQDNLFSSAIFDECLMKWKVSIEAEYWDLDNLEYNEKQVDTISEVTSKDKFLNQINEILPQRNEIYQATQILESIQQPNFELRLKSIIGRKAFNCRKNVFYDHEERIIYQAGSNIVINSLVNGIPQSEFLQVDESNSFSSSPEISIITFSNDCRLICAGTIQYNSKLIIWDICSKSCLRSFSLQGAIEILYISFAEDNNHICCVALNDKYESCVYLIDSINQEILGQANFCYSVPFKIRDIEFMPGSCYSFVACGRQTMQIWEYKGGKLSYKNLEIENPKQIIEIIENDSDAEDIQYNKAADEEERVESQNKDQLEVSFMCLTFFNDIIITGGDDGYLYLWEQNKIIKKYKAHLHQAILCIKASKYLCNLTTYVEIFATGGSDGNVILWSIKLTPDSKNFQIKFIQKYDIQQNSQDQNTVIQEYQIQSVYFGQKNILAGLRNGDVYELSLTLDKDNSQDNKLYKQRIGGQDGEIPKSAQFNISQDKLFTLSKKGLFSVWDLNTLQRLYCKPFDKVTKSMVVCTLTPRIIIALEYDIQILKNINNTYLPESKVNLVYNSSIQLIKLSNNEKYFAVALAPSLDQPAKIIIYDYDNVGGKFDQTYTIDEIACNVELLDFSTDNQYLLYKDAAEEIIITDLQTQKKVNFIYVEQDLTWCSDGVQIHEKAGGIHQHYAEDNRIQKVVKIKDLGLIVTDEMGSIRIFDYPCESGAGMNKGFMRCYSQHLNYITTCNQSNDSSLLVTASELDRLYLIWQIVKVQK